MLEARGERYNAFPSYRSPRRDPGIKWHLLGTFNEAKGPRSQSRCPFVLSKHRVRRRVSRIRPEAVGCAIMRGDMRIPRFSASPITWVASLLFAARVPTPLAHFAKPISLLVAVCLRRIPSTPLPFNPGPRICTREKSLIHPPRPPVQLELSSITSEIDNSLFTPQRSRVRGQINVS